MAMGNWATFATTLSGKRSSGDFKSPDGLTVSIYKNWLYLAHPDLWNDRMGLASPTIAEMQHGDLRLGRTTIHAKRGGTQASVLVAVFHTEYQEQIDGEPYKAPIHTGMVGIGCYGYRGDVWVGVDQATLQELKSWLEELKIDGKIPSSPSIESMEGA